MKNINFKIVLFLIVSMTVSNSCEDLEEEPEGLLSPETFYANEADFEAATVGVYSNLYGGWGGFDWHNSFLISAGAEDVTSKSTAPNLKQYDEFRQNANSDLHFNMWKALYAAINNANSIVGNIDNLDGVTTEEKANEYEGQARFLRAFSYFYLVRWFGEVPIITFENQTDAATVGQSPVADIYALIIEDLEMAEKKLPVSFSVNGKATRGAATGLLSKVYLTMTGWPLEDASKYALARDKAAELITGPLAGTYQLERDFADLWKVENKLTSSELMFAFYGTSSAGGDFASKFHHSTRPTAEGGWSDWFSETRFFNEFPDGYRKEVSFHTDFADGSAWQDGEFISPFIAKYRDAGTACGPEDGVCSAIEGDFMNPMLRYADILLVYAEAANMAEGGPSAAALEAINQVRRRANNLDPNTPDGSVDLPDGMSMADFDDAVLAERNWELAFELNRWFDLVRKKMVVEVNRDLYPNVTENHRLLPKPGVEVELIDGLEQNPGY